MNRKKRPTHYTRLGHKKSRNGCLRCKSRHVKCDEKRPCTNCVRFDIPCSLLDAPRPNAPSPRLLAAAPQEGEDAGPATTSPPQRVPPSEATPGQPSVASPQQAPVPSPLSFDGKKGDYELSPLWMRSLRLLHHYSTQVCESLSRDPSMVEIWRNTVPEAAFKHKFLMHGLLAVSAVHYAHTYPEHQREYVLVSNHYQGLALEFFSTHLDEITADNFEPHFFLGTFIFLLTMWSTSHPEHRDSDPPLSPQAVAQAFHFLQGIKLIVAVKRPEHWKKDGPLSPLVHASRPARGKMSSGPFQARMDRLTALARDLAPSLDIINTQSSCLLAIEGLRNTHCTSRATTIHLGAREIWIWPVTLSRLFVDLISENHPVALIIVAHYAALGRPYEYSWVNKGWSRNVLAAVESALEGRWLEWIAWPKRSMEECIDVDEMEEDGRGDVKASTSV